MDFPYEDARISALITFSSAAAPMMRIDVPLMDAAIVSK
jgi:hypothetical protein